MKNELAALIAILIFLGSIIYIMGQAGAVDCYEITVGQCAARVGVALVVLGLDTLWINKHWKGGEWV